MSLNAKHIDKEGSSKLRVALNGDNKNDLSGSYIILQAAKELIALGFNTLPTDDKVPTSKVKSVNKLRSHPVNDKNVDFFFLMLSKWPFSPVIKLKQLT